MNYFDWKIELPPINTWVWVSYNIENNNWQLVKTCKNGCCVHSNFGTLVLPKFWYFATIEEGINEQKKWKNNPGDSAFF